MKRAGIATAIGMLAAFTAYAPAAAPALSAPVPGAKCSSETSAAQARVRAGSHATERHQPGAAKVAAMEKDFHNRLGQLATSGRLKAAAAASITVRVHFQVIEGSRRRTQVFEGIVIKRQGAGARETFTVRKQSFGVGVERTFPVHSPKIEKIDVAAIGDVNRAKLYYLRGKVGKQARVREKQR